MECENTKYENTERENMEFAFVFSGQGSQTLKMMDGFKDQTLVRDIFAEAQVITGVDYWNMLQEDNADNINCTINTQPLMLVAEYAIYQLWLEFGGAKPSILAGHSLGEWTAVLASEVLSFEQALELVLLRASYMQGALSDKEGAMVVVMGIDDDKLIAICDLVSKDLGKVVEGVNFNCKGQVVIAGEKDAVMVASDLLKNAGAKKTQLLSVSIPSHCLLMKEASNKLARDLEGVQFQTPKIPVIHNYDNSINTDVTAIKNALIKQMYLPVLWSATINKIVTMGILHIMECAPSKVLTGLNKRIDPNIISYNLMSDVSINSILMAEPLFQKG